MRRINLNKFSREITLEEGGAVSISIAQTKEVLKLTFTKLVNEYQGSEIFEMLERYVED